MRSINLLSSDHQDALRQEFWRRVVLFYGKVALILLVVLAVELIALDLGVRIEHQSLVEGAMFKKELEELTGLEQRAGQIESMAMVAERFIVELPLASYELGEVLAAVSPEIIITRIEFTREGKRIELAGRAADRKALLAFEERLTKSPVVVKTVLPFGNLVKAKDIDFVMTVNLL